MAYITTTQLSGRLGSTIYARLTDRVNGTSADATVAQQIVDEAEALTDSYLSKRFATPVDLSAHPELVNVFESRVLDLAEWIAWKGSPFVSGVPDRVQTVADEAMSWFEAVAAGRIHLPAASPPASRTAENDAPRYTAEDRKFTADELDGL
jgi:phage gp36-like protein